MNKDRPRQEIEEAIANNDTEHLLLLNGILHGHYCPGSAMGVKAAVRAVREMNTNSTGMEEVVAIVETNSCFSDGVQMVTGCSFGNNGLIYHDYGKTALILAKRNGDGIRLALRAESSPLQKYPEAAELFKKVVQERRGTEEENEKLRQLWIDISFKILEIPDEELFNINRVKTEVPAYAGIFSSVKCSVCDENIMEPRARVKDGKYVCIPCSGQAYYRLDGNGLSLVGG